ncbi:pentapeptide repeat-containing protein [Desulfovibrio sp. Huiquan2017]|uniref:pentapeptide repeat-containing protein n=1 Tax=Desulfovibrio sp. Huiquan2017 TaxID=2816861 RepID=UPI001A90DB06|nr:pentapeptide repeat-containing protein [Desulfovibrio sp. Huiquan2017]
MTCCKCEEHKWDDPQEVVYTDPANGKEYCLFHAPADCKGISVDAFNEKALERIKAASVSGGVDVLCNLSGTIFPGDFNAKGHDFPAINLFRAVFTQGAHFGGARFGGMAIFSDVHFGGKVNFNKARFKTGAVFSGCRFKGYPNFYRANFAGETSFSKAIFDEDTCFDMAGFEEAVDFTSAHFLGGAKFSGVSFGAEALFKGVSFACGTKFTTVQVKGVIVFDAIQAAEGAVLEFVDCIVSPSVLVFQNCDLTCCDFSLQRDLTNIHFVNSSWENKCRIKPNGEDQKGKLQLTRDFYQRMKAKYKGENNEYEASKWHVAEKEAQLKLFRWNGESKFLWIMLWLYKFVSGFGENAARAFWVLIGLAVLPLLALTCMGVVHHSPWWDFDMAGIHQIIKDWLKFIPLARTIGEDEPGGLHVLMIFWQLLITLQAALFAFALRNRFRR